MEQRLNKVLAHCGIGSRRKCEQLIFDKQIYLDGEVCTVPQTKVDPQKQTIVYQGKVLSLVDSPLYFALNKPEGYVCSNKRLGRQKLVIDLFQQEATRLFSIGRLDKMTCGLLIVTNDGSLTHKVAHPSFAIEKEYLVKTDQTISPEHLLRLREPCYIEGQQVTAKQVKKIRKNSLSITLLDGKKHEVRLLCAQARLSVLLLQRIRIGNLRLGSLPIGAYKALLPRQIDALFQK